MAQTIKLKRSATSGAAPSTSDLALGEVAINTYDGKMYIKKSVGGTESIVEIGTGSGGSSSATAVEPVKLDAITTVNNQAAYSLTRNSSAHSPSNQNALIVSLNGVTQEPGDSFTTSGSTITFSPALVTGDVVDYIIDLGREINTTGGDSRKNYTANGSITQGNAVVLDTSNGTVKAVASESAEFGDGTTIAAVSPSKSTIDYDDYNDLYYYFYLDGTDLKADILTPDYPNSSFSDNSTDQTVVESVGSSDPIKYVHLPGTSTGILFYDEKISLISQSGGTFTANTAVNAKSGMSVAVDIAVGPNNTPLILGQDGSGNGKVAAVSISGTSLTVGTSVQTSVGSTASYNSYIFYEQNKIVVVQNRNSANQLQYDLGTVSGSTVTMDNPSNTLTVSTTSNYPQLYYHKGIDDFVLARNDNSEIKLRPISFSGTALSAEVEVSTGWTFSNTFQNMGFQFSSTGTGVAIVLGERYWTGAHYEYPMYEGLGTLTSAGSFTRTSTLSAVTFEGSSNGRDQRSFEAAPSKNKTGQGVIIVKIDRHNTTNITESLLIRLDTVSTSDSWLGVAAESVTDGNTVDVILGGGVANLYTGLTINGKYYVQDNGSISNTVSSVFAGVAVASTSIQVADAKDVFTKTFAEILNTPTTLAGYGIDINNEPGVASVDDATALAIALG